jgi:predicted KAP-like P-loop ATPase
LLSIKIITDEPSSEDALNFKNYSLKLAEIIRNSTPRFSIGIFGGWGTGKTTLMLMTKDILDNEKK